MGTLNMLRRAALDTRFVVRRRVLGLEPPGDAPWMDDDGTARFNTELKRASRYLEYGSGGTTVMADRIGIPTRSVESDPVYARAVKSRLQNENVRQIVVDFGMTRSQGYPLRPSPAKGRAYASAPFARHEPFPDLVLVDGRYRAACALECALRAFERDAKATMLLDDFVGRSEYGVVAEQLGAPEIAGRLAVFTIGECSIDESALIEAYAVPR
ncbi:MAG: hypothetical protein WA985_09970 [Erythrobacter sp.]